jgi:hypothetical protein
MPTKADLEERVLELEDALEDALDLTEYARVIEARRTHIPYTWLDYPNGRIGLDANGHIARIELHDGGQVLA